MKKIRIVAIVGATASGKSEAGIRVARAVGGEVICVDSRTVYKGMNIGTAKPCGQLSAPEARRVIHSVTHWGTDLVEPNERFTVVDFQKYADERIADIDARGKVPILVGGTGLYFRAIIDRPNYAPQKEKRSFGVPVYDVLQIGIDVPRSELYRRIDLRVDDMIACGLVDEARALFAKFGADARAMSGIGYRELHPFFHGGVSLEDAIAKIKIDSRHYAKRQLTWFKNDKRVRWVDGAEEAMQFAKTFLR